MLLNLKSISESRSIGSISIHLTLFIFLGGACLVAFSPWEEAEADLLKALLFRGVVVFLHKDEVDLLDWMSIIATDGLN